MEQWQTVCQQSDLIQDTGICALLNHEQVAIFFCRHSQQLYALSNYDPIGQANVMSRGIIGSLGDQKVVASPLYKQHFSLHSGECLEAPEYRLKTYDVRLSQGKVQLREN
ncbi:nitrite reductase small subunit NirD [Photobacterium sp. TY1-4]|uniref:nitrite reductase small subunit NirD n=1 Tax=Photobacterium sp. TY1-4 TaxID=2899122 RepID=UPI0021BFB256|nr:nitrite reductase small subunit NirD [Photobacterium sp. TY1-4]UXI02198.1 nitrite reductase small subunit NirD [Photobacterium sp. TY1-4]